MDPELLNRTRQVRLGEVVLAIVSREDFIAMKAFAGGPVDLADARAVIDLDRESLDLELLRRLARRQSLSGMPALRSTSAQRSMTVLSR